MNDQRARWLAYLSLCAGMAVVGSYVGFSKLLVAAIPIYLLALLRFAISAVMMAPFTFPPGSLALIRRNWRTLFFQSFFGNFLFSICMLSGVARTSATAAGLILSTLPAVVALVSTLALRERLSARTVLAVLFAVGGVATLTLTKDVSRDAQGASWLGNLLVFGAVVCEAAYVVLGKRLTAAAVTPFQISAWINLVGLVLVLPLGLVQGMSYHFAGVPPLIWLLLIVYALAASILSTWLWLNGLKRVPASQAGVFTVALPISAALIGLCFLHERLDWAQGIAFACASCGVLLVAFAPTSAPSAPSQAV